MQRALALRGDHLAKFFCVIPGVRHRSLLPSPYCSANCHPLSNTEKVRLVQPVKMVDLAVLCFALPEGEHQVDTSRALVYAAPWAVRSHHPRELRLIGVEVLCVQQPMVPTAVQVIRADPAGHRTPRPFSRAEIGHISGAVLRENAFRVSPETDDRQEVIRLRRQFRHQM
jgi:hypothetical protein